MRAERPASYRCPRIAGISFLALAVIFAQGCASTPSSGLYEGNVTAVDHSSPGAVNGYDRGYHHPVVAVAASLEGAPYRYGGHTPRGFDCSGLVFYAYNRVGIPVPRTTSGQRRRAHAVPLSELRPGDVLFFVLEGKKVSHVGIYAGGGSFIHAPSSGKKVSYASLESEYWRDRLVGAGRFN